MAENRKTELKLVFGAPKGTRPKAGQLYLMKTTMGFIPVGIASTNSFFGGAVTIHPYRALVTDPTDTSWYPLVEKNELLIPPLMIQKRDFRKGGDFYRIEDKNAPTTVPFDKYYYYSIAMAWNSDELAFAPTSAPMPHDRPASFIPAEGRQIAYRLHDTNPPKGGKVEQAPEGTYFMPSGLIIDMDVEFAFEDALSYYGLIDTPRPTHADFGDDEEKPTQTADTNQPFLRIDKIKGKWGLFAYTSILPEGVEDTVTEAGYLPNGYFFDTLTRYLLEQADTNADTINYDSEAGMFSIDGPIDILQSLKDQLTELCDNPDKLQQTIEQAEATGIDFNDD